MVSVIILTSHERCSQENKKFVNSLINQTYKDFEVILAIEKGIVNAMNIALAKVKGEITIRIDDDVYLPPTWLEELIKPFGNPQVAGATGPTFIPYRYRKNRDSIRIAENPNRFLRWLFDNEPFAFAKIYKCGSVSYGSNFQEKISDWQDKIDHLEGTNWAMRTDLIRQVGGFDPAFDGVAEWFDDDVVFKIKKFGYKLIYNPKAFLWHLPKKSGTFEDRYKGWSRIKNWLRFHWRHSKFHPKMIIWLCLMIGYMIWKKFRS